jgi:hypothetical protein
MHPVNTVNQLEVHSTRLQGRHRPPCRTEGFVRELLSGVCHIRSAKECCLHHLPKPVEGSTSRQSLSREPQQMSGSMGATHLLPADEGSQQEACSCCSDVAPGAARHPLPPAGINSTAAAHQ